MIIKTFEQFIAHLTSFKPHLLLITSDFNARSSSWWSGDVENIEGTRLESIISLYGLINESTHILPSSSSCIDLISTNQSKMITDSGVHPSLHESRHHQIIFAKINMKIFYLPPYKRLIWDYRNVHAINPAIAMILLGWLKILKVK